MSWLNPYIEFNTNKRKQATSSFEDFFKLMNHSVFGNEEDNLILQRNVELYNSERRSKELLSSSAFSSFEIFSDEPVAVDRRKTILTMSRSIYVGFAILKLSKLHMQKTYYNLSRKYTKTKLNSYSQIQTPKTIIYKHQTSIQA